jgi:hypothetical protein
MVFGQYQAILDIVGETISLQKESTIGFWSYLVEYQP